MLENDNKFDRANFDNLIKKYSLYSLLIYGIVGIISGAVSELLFNDKYNGYFLYFSLLLFVLVIYPIFIKSKIKEFPNNYWKMHYLAFVSFFAIIGIFGLGLAAKGT